MAFMIALAAGIVSKLYTMVLCFANNQMCSDGTGINNGIGYLAHLGRVPNIARQQALYIPVTLGRTKCI